jgi:DNA polymerase-3 subunit epsilon
MNWPDERMLAFDLETTSTDPFTAAPVSFAMVAVEGGKVGKGRVGLVKPGIPIPPGASDVHGITDEMVAARGGDLDKTINGIYDHLIDVQNMGIPVVGSNLRYDLTVVDTHLRRIHRHGLRELGWEGHCLDALVLDRYVDKYRTGKRNLAALCHHYRINFDTAHNAADDAVAAVNIVRAIAAAKIDVRESSLEALQIIQRDAYHEFIAHLRDYNAEKGRDPIGDEQFGWPLPGELPEGEEL